MTTTRTSPVRYHLSWIGIAAVAALMSPVPVSAQTRAFPGAAWWPNDPTPQIEGRTDHKSIAVQVEFLGQDYAEVNNVTVFYGPSPARKGAPRMLMMEARKLDGQILESFNAWHPLVHGIDGSGGNPVREEGPGTFIFPLREGVASLSVTNAQTSHAVVTVDLVPAIHGFCRQNRRENECVAAANRAPTCVAGGPYVFECRGSTTTGVLLGASGTDADGDPLSFTWNGPFGVARGREPSVQFTGTGSWPAVLAVNDDFGAVGTCATQTSVSDTTPPVISPVSVSPARLWPPNHKLIPVVVTYRAEDVCIGQPTCELSVASNEPTDGLGDGDASPDWQVIDSHLVYVRAERSGKGRGRVYTVTVACRDESNNVTRASATVQVPHSL